MLLKDVGIAHLVLLSTKMVHRFATPASLDFINWKREEHRRRASPVLEGTTKKREGTLQPTDLQRLFQERQDAMHVQQGTVKVFATEHCVSSV